MDCHRGDMNMTSNQHVFIMQDFEGVDFGNICHLFAPILFMVFWHHIYITYLSKYMMTMHNYLLKSSQYTI